MKVSIFVGDICEAPADVICTSTNPLLDLMTGTGGAVRERGGWEVQEACKAITKENFRQVGRRALDMGTVHLTHAGRLPYAAVLHCVAVDSFHATSLETIADCTRGAMDLAQTEGYKTIAMPAFGSGGGEFDFVQCAEAMLNVLHGGDWPGVERVWFVAHDSTRARVVYPAFESRFGLTDIRIQPGRSSAEVPKLKL